MLTGSRIITCHVTMEHTPPLPSGFNINGYLIRSLKQTDSLCHVYYASDANHVQYLLREFCPQGLAVRDPESGKLRYPENTDIEREVLPLKNDFEAQFRTGSLGEIPALGTLYLAYAIPGGHAAAQPAPGTAAPAASLLQRDQRTLATPGTAGAAPVHAGSLPQLRKKKNSAGIWILTLLLLGGACGTYYFTRNPAEKPVSAQEPDVPHSNREKKAAPRASPRPDWRSSRKKRRRPLPPGNGMKMPRALWRKNPQPPMHSLTKTPPPRQMTLRTENSRNRNSPPTGRNHRRDRLPPNLRP